MHFVTCIGTFVFALAICHTLAIGVFKKLENSATRYTYVWHLLSEVEIVFGLWGLVFLCIMLIAYGGKSTYGFVSTLHFTEPLFVFVIMVVSGSRPIKWLAAQIVESVARIIPLHSNSRSYFAILAITPLLGAFITEPAAMVLAALMLSQRIFSLNISSQLKYATLGALCVNISIGGTVTVFAATPVLMVAHTWGWDNTFMFSTFGWKAILVVISNALLATRFAHKELRQLPILPNTHAQTRIPVILVLLHVFFLIAIVACAHSPLLFIALFLAFLIVCTAFSEHQDPLLFREGALVAFFLAGLVVLGSQQDWWLQAVLQKMSAYQVFWGATVITAFTDNAAITYLGSKIPTLSEGFKYALVAGAMTGGGLTLIANAPNPAGAAILQGHFEKGIIRPLGLLLAALLPTAIAALAFTLL